MKRFYPEDMARNTFSPFSVDVDLLARRVPVARLAEIFGIPDNEVPAYAKALRNDAYRQSIITARKEAL